MTFWFIAFFAILLALTFLAGWKWYAMRGANVAEAERQIFARFALGVAVFWLFAAAMYFGAPLLAGLK
jgi:hypothetical protein